jgi:PAS domain S-box-containing protein
MDPFERDAKLLRAIYFGHVFSWPILFFLNDGVPFKTTAVVAFLFAIGALVLIRKHLNSIPRLLAAPVLLFALISISWSNGGVFDSCMLALPIVVLIGSSFYGRAGVIIYTALIVMLSLITCYLQLQGIIPNPFGDVLTWENAFDLTVIYCAFSFVLWGVMSIMEGDIARATESESLYRLLAENVHDVVWTMNLRGTVLYCSDSVFKQRGFTAEEIVGTSFDSYSPPKTSTLLKKNLKDELDRDLDPNIDRNRISTMEIEICCADGSKKWVETVSSFLRDNDDQPIGVLGVTRDIDERRKSDVSRRALESKMQDMQKMEGLGILAGGIAHDFNNILVGIMGYNDLALNKIPANVDGREYIEESVTSARQAADLCKQLLAYSGRGQFVVKAVDLAEMVASMMKLLQVTISKDIELSGAFEEETPLIEADATQIQQAVMNLVINGAEAIGETPGKISISVGSQTIAAAHMDTLIGNPNLEPGSFVYLDVTDSGCGMDEVTIEKMFNPFFSTKESGHGLGLSALIGIIRGHRGGMAVHSEPGEGTSIRLLFPATDITPANPASESSEESRPLEGLKILVVDDEDSVRNFVKKSLELRGHKVLDAQNGQEGITIFRERSSEIDAVLMDLTMPVMSGQEAFLEMRNIKPDARVVLISGYSDFEVATEFDENGNVNFLQKPFRIEQLIDALNSVVLGKINT